MNPRKIVLSAFGSLGDLFPSIALAQELKRRGYEPVIAANAEHRAPTESRGIPFEAIRPDIDDFGPRA